jgi:DNA-binding response OmpR family regulator
VNADAECADNKELAMLMLHQENEPDQCWPITQAEVTIGRGSDCNIVLADRQVSRRHAVIRRVAAECFIRDLQSKNGTWVNGQVLKGEHPLQDGDEIHIALRFRLAFVAPGATTPLLFEEDDTLSSPLVLDKEGHRVWIKGKELDPPLSLAQYRLLELLCDGAGRVSSRDEIVQAVWPEALEEGVSEQAIDALTRRLRQRLAEADIEHQYIVTVRGHGFRLDNSAQ